MVMVWDNVASVSQSRMCQWKRHTVLSIDTFSMDKHYVIMLFAHNVIWNPLINNTSWFLVTDPALRDNHYSGVTWSPWRLKSPAVRLFVRHLVFGKHNNKAKTRAIHYRPLIWKIHTSHLWGEFAVGGWIPAQMVTNAESISMSSHHHSLCAANTVDHLGGY